MRRAVLPWLVATGLLLVATTVGVAVANATVFSSTAFVRVYLDAVARGDSDGALGLAGVQQGEADDELLASTIEPGLTDIRHVATSQDGPLELVVFSWTLRGESGETQFAVRRAGSSFGVFSEWSFARSPTATVDIDALHDPRYRVNGIDAIDAGRPIALAVPGTYVVDHHTELLDAAPQTIVAATVGQRIGVSVDAEANAAFVELVTDEVHGLLDACATQEVLQPTGCPFGETVTDRIASTPEWTISEYPAVRVEPGSVLGEWRVPDAAAAAHLVVDIRSIFDGDVTTFDRDVPFEVSYGITLGTDDTPVVSADP